jgi:hypothetical protein
MRMPVMPRKDRANMEETRGNAEHQNHAGATGRFFLEISGMSAIMGNVGIYGDRRSRMRCLIILLALVGAVWTAGCAGPPEIGEPPKRTRYEIWGARLSEIPEIIQADKLCSAGLEHHRKSNLTGKRGEIIDELDMAIALFRQSSEQLFEAWRKYPEYESFIRMELDKVWGYVFTCVSKKPYFVEPLDPLNVLRGSLSYEQRARKAEYEHQLSRWIQSPGK